MNEIEQAALLKSLLESYRDKSQLDISDEVRDDQFQVPIVPDKNNESVFHLIDKAEIKKLNEIMITYIKF